MRWNPIWGGSESNAWFTLIKDPKLEPEVYLSGDYAPFFNQTEILELTDAANGLIEQERLTLPN